MNDVFKSTGGTTCSTCGYTLQPGQGECPNCGAFIEQSLTEKILPQPSRKTESAKPAKTSSRIVEKKLSAPKPPGEYEKGVVVELSDSLQLLMDIANEYGQAGNPEGALAIYRRALGLAEKNQGNDASIQLAIQTLSLLIRRIEEVIAIGTKSGSVQSGQTESIPQTVETPPEAAEEPKTKEKGVQESEKKETPETHSTVSGTESSVEGLPTEPESIEQVSVLPIPKERALTRNEIPPTSPVPAGQIAISYSQGNPKNYPPPVKKRAWWLWAAGAGGLLVVACIVIAVLVVPGLLAATPSPAPTDALVATEPSIPTAAPTSPYIEPGTLDGNSVPPNFFSDIHVRKAFSYAFDWNTFIADAYEGEAVQSFELVLPGMPGYDPNAPHYTMDLDKAAAEFKASTLISPDGKSLWDTGFHIQMPYNEGNFIRQEIAEILAVNLSKINPKFVVEIVRLPGPDYLAAQRAGQIPIMTAGWQEDIHDPHNWYQPYTTGGYGGRQNMPADLKAQFKALLDQGVGLTDPVARSEVYYQFNQLYYDTVPGVALVLATSHEFEQVWVQGRIMNPILSGLYFPPISKADTAKDPTTFTYLTFGDAATMDPALAYDVSSSEVIQNVYQTLVFYDGPATDEFVPQLAESWEISADGTTYIFHIRSGVKFHNGDVMTPSDVAYSFQRGLLQSGTASPQWLLTEPFFGIGIDDISLLVDPEGNLYDDREALAAADPTKLMAACEQVKTAVVADDAAFTVTMKLAQAWGPFLPTIAQTWGSVMDQKWVTANGGWDGSCNTWQNFYAMTSADDPLNIIMNGTGAFKLDHWNPSQEIMLARNEDYWGTSAKLERVVIQIVPEWSTRFAELQAGDADVVDVPIENRSQADALVAERCEFDLVANTYKPCTVVDATKQLRLYIGRPSIAQDVIIYNFDIH